MKIMNKTLKKVFIITAVIAVINMIATLLCITKLPDIVPVRFDAGMICSDVGSRWNGLVPSVILVIVLILFYLSERKKAAPEKNSKAIIISLLLADFIVVAVNWFFLGIMKTGLGVGDKLNVENNWLILMIIGFVFVIIGNYMPLIPQNRFLGVRVPWTLNNENCWKHTHRFAGRISVIAGLAAIAFSMCTKIWDFSSSVVIAVYMCLLGVIAVIPLIYAFIHKND